MSFSSPIAIPRYIHNTSKNPDLLTKKPSLYQKLHPTSNLHFPTKNLDLTNSFDLSTKNLHLLSTTLTLPTMLTFILTTLTLLRVILTFTLIRWITWLIVGLVPRHEADLLVICCKCANTAKQSK